MERPLHYVLISPVLLSFMVERVESGRENGEKMFSAVQYLTISPPRGRLQPELRLSWFKHINQPAALDTYPQEYTSFAHHMA